MLYKGFANCNYLYEVVKYVNGLAVPLGVGFGFFMGALSLFTTGMPYVGNAPEKTTATTLLQEVVSYAIRNP